MAQGQHMVEHSEPRGSLIGPIVVGILLFAVGFGASSLTNSWRDDYGIVLKPAVLLHLACAVTFAVAVFATRAWPKHWWWWGIVPAAPCSYYALLNWRDLVYYVRTGAMPSVSILCLWVGTFAFLAAGLMGGRFASASPAPVQASSESRLKRWLPVTPVVVYVATGLLGIFTVIGTTVLSYPVANMPLILGLAAGVALELFTISFEATWLWPDRWWRWGLPAAVVVAAPILLFLPGIFERTRDAAQGFAAWGGTVAALYIMSLLGARLGLWRYDRAVAAADFGDVRAPDGAHT